MKYIAERSSLTCDCHWSVLDSEGFTVAENVSEDFAVTVVRALNRDELFDRMAESMRANAGELCTDIVCQRIKEFCGICYSCDARALLTEIDALKG